MNLNDHKEKIAECKRQINLTDSSQRKYELHRHLRKLQKEYKIALNYMRASKGYVMNGKT